MRRASRRVWRAGRVVAAAITFTVLSWTGSQTLGFLTDKPDRGKAELILLTKSRARLELALEHGIFAGLTPLRDVAGLADNMPLLIFAVYLVFRASAGMMPPVGLSAGAAGRAEVTPAGRHHRSRVSGWSTLIWGCGALYVLYKLVARAAGSAELPLGGCLVAEAVVIPLMMLVCDGFLLAWVLVEIRNAGFDDPGDEGLHPGQALELMPAAALAWPSTLPARYVATLVFLGSQHLPTSSAAGAMGRYIRWQLGWGLVDLQAAALVAMGLVGVVAWSRGSIGESLGGLIRLLRSQAGHLVAALAMAGAAACLLAAVAYAVVLLLPPGVMGAPRRRQLRPLRYPARRPVDLSPRWSSSASVRCRWPCRPMMEPRLRSPSMPDPITRPARVGQTVRIMPRCSGRDPRRGLRPGAARAWIPPLSARTQMSARASA